APDAGNDELSVAEGERVALGKPVSRDRRAVDEGAVGGARIDEPPRPAFENRFRVMAARERRVGFGEDERVVAAASEGDAGPGEDQLFTAPRAGGVLQPQQPHATACGWCLLRWPCR